MKKFGVLLLAAVLLFVAVASAGAHDRFHGGVFVGPLLLAPLLIPFAVAATITAGVAAAVTAPFTYPYAPYPPAPAYAPPVSAAPPPPTYAPPLSAAPPPPTYAPSVSAAPPPPAPSYWYYCQNANAYYPYVSACPGGWLTVAPR